MMGAVKPETPSISPVAGLEPTQGGMKSSMSKLASSFSSIVSSMLPVLIVLWVYLYARTEIARLNSIVEKLVIKASTPPKLIGPSEPPAGAPLHEDHCCSSAVPCARASTSSAG